MLPTPLPWSPSETRGKLGREASRTLILLGDDNTMAALVDHIIQHSGITQTELARRLGVVPQTINQYRTLKRKRPSLQWIARLCLAAGARLMVEWPEAASLPSPASQVVESASGSDPVAKRASEMP